MKAGDLVTISAYGKRLVSLTDQMRSRNHALRHAISPDAPYDVSDDELPPLVGIVTKITEGRHQWSKAQYSVKFAGTGIPGRSRWEKTFTRKDLKIVSKAR